MKNKSKMERRYILVEFDGTTTKAVTFRSSQLINLLNDPDNKHLKGFRYSEAKLHPDDDYDQNEGLRIALSRIGFDIENNPFSNVLKALKLVADVFGDCTND